MDLAPAERAALARIERQLSDSDPYLAAALATMSWPPYPRYEPVPASCLQPGSQARRLWLLAAVVTLLLSVLWGATLGSSRGRPWRPGACGGTASCQSPHRANTGRTAGVQGS